MSVLQQPGVRAIYHRHFIGAHADFGELQLDDNDPGHAMVERRNPRKLRPLIVFLDPQGKEVARHTGKLASTEEALLLARFVAERHYLKMDFADFRATGGRP